jgi:RNase_H superfamily
MLDEIARHIPPDAWLVTYNGRGFDWPLLVTRFRLARRHAPQHAGHLDLLPIVRRLFRHRMDDARLGTVERMLLGVVRHDDVDGWEIPGRYLGFLRGGPAQPLAAVVRHNDEDVRSLARLLVRLERDLGDATVRATAPRGDLAGLARAFRRERRLEEAVACLDAALDAEDDPAPRTAPLITARAPVTLPEEPWWSPRRRPDFGGRPQRRSTTVDWDRRQAFDRPWDTVRIRVDRAHLLRRMGRTVDALEAWESLAHGPGRTAIVAVIEAAKLREHRLADAGGALATVERGLNLADRRRALGMPEPDLETDLRHRWRRLRRRLAA